MGASGGESPLTPPQEAAESDDDEAARREICKELDRGISHERQLLSTRTDLRQLKRTLAGRDERLRVLEKEVVDLHLLRYNEHMQCAALMQQQLQPSSGGGPK